MKLFPPIVAAAVALCAVGAVAEDAVQTVGDDTDWLIARRDGQWELVARGATGRVHKEYANQEVLRLGPDGTIVEVVSMPPITADDEAACSQRARRDARDPCSSSFLACRPDPGAFITTSAQFLIGDAEGARDRRNRLACRVDVDAILQAAKDVGMIRRILPRFGAAPNP